MKSHVWTSTLFLAVASLMLSCSDSSFKGIGGTKNDTDGKGSDAFTSRKSDPNDPNGDPSSNPGVSTTLPGNPGSGGSEFQIINEIMVGDCSDARDTINFETGNPSLGSAISEQYKATHGVTFSLVGGGQPSFSQYNRSTSLNGGFNCEVAGCTSMASGVVSSFASQVGQYFLGLGSNGGAELEVRYERPVKAASGDILDVDNNENFSISVYSEDGRSIYTTELVAGPGEMTNAGRPKRFQITSERGFNRMVIKNRKTGFAHAGLGFDNFSPAAACPQ